MEQMSEQNETNKILKYRNKAEKCSLFDAAKLYVKKILLE